MQTTTTDILHLIQSGIGFTVGIECPDRLDHFHEAKQTCPVAGVRHDKWHRVTAEEYAETVLDWRYEDGQWGQ